MQLFSERRLLRIKRREDIWDLVLDEQERQYVAGVYHPEDIAKLCSLISQESTLDALKLARKMENSSKDGCSKELLFPTLFATKRQVFLSPNVELSQNNKMPSPSTVVDELSAITLFTPKLRVGAKVSPVTRKQLRRTLVTPFLSPMGGGRTNTFEKV